MIKYERYVRLSKHFTLYEFTESATADKLGILNVPDIMHMANLGALCYLILEPVHDHFGLPINIRSGFRSAVLNKEVGGARDSQHLLGEAADIEIEGVRNDEIWKFIADSTPFDQVIAERCEKDNGSAGWVHVSHKLLGPQRREALSSPVKGLYMPGLEYAR